MRRPFDGSIQRNPVMIEHHFDKTHAILHVQPKAPLEQSDFQALAREVDPFISEAGDLAGLIVEASGFPGWSSFASMIAHFRFVRDHHRHIRRIAVVTDSPWAIWLSTWLPTSLPRRSSRFRPASSMPPVLGSLRDGSRRLLSRVCEFGREGRQCGLEIQGFARDGET
jgi:hypothetical protein